MTRIGFVSALFALAATSSAAAAVKTETVTYEHDGQKLVGFLAWDDSSTARRPGVLVVHEWWGLNDYARRRAKMLAELGYVAFALDMYGDGKVTQHPREAGQWASQIRSNVDRWRGRAMAGLNVLRNHKLVDPSRLAAIGYCFGGATVLEMAYAGADLRGVVSFHGSLPVPDEAEARRIKASILVCHGAADGFTPEERIQQFRAALDKAGADWLMVYYAGARHSFTNPDAGNYGIEGIRYNRKADRRSWAHMRQFFDEIFATR